MTTPANSLPDLQARATALVALERNLLVEAGAGSGKTALMAGRVAMLIAAGIQPRDIVAITFTEAAAAELLERIERFVQSLCRNKVPIELRAGLEQGLSASQRASLEAGAASLNEMVCTTIHGFCQRLIGPYAVETGLDPGARIIDPAAADLAYEDLLKRWLSARLGRTSGMGMPDRIPTVQGTGKDGDLIADLIASNPDATIRLVRELALFLKEHRTARAPDPLAGLNKVKELRTAVTALGEWYRRCPLEEPKTERIVDDLESFAANLPADSPETLTASETARLLFVKPPACAKRDGTGFKQSGVKGRWKAAAKQGGGSVAYGEQLFSECDRIFRECGDLYSEYWDYITSLAVKQFVDEFKELRNLYHEYKRGAALLDFDDLLHHARDLLKGNDSVRAALAVRYPRILVDEFQDTDPLQAEILWLLAGEGSATIPWFDRRIRSGALFLVGDPKQAIYRFRGCDVHTYLLAKDSMSKWDADAVVEVNTNFRAREPILSYVNENFETMLSTERGQPGFAPLRSTREAADRPSVAAFRVHLDPRHKKNGKLLVGLVRAEEARTVACLVGQLIGEYPIRESSRQSWRPAQARDIALLAPTGSSLWMYEQALEESGIPIASQAGKGFFRRQEVHDLIAIARAIADHRDTLAFGALIRGPLVGLTEEQIADEIESLREAGSGEGRLFLWTVAQHVRNALLRGVLTVLQNLARKARTRTPYQLLSEAIDELNVRAILKARHPRSAERALANIELILEMARAYSGRGIEDFARAMRDRWSDGDAQVEGRPDAAADAVSIITIHSAKGLEWPIVIPINSTTKVRSIGRFLHRRRDDTVHFPMFGSPGMEYHRVKAEQAEEETRERIRLWYVALTRARDLLLLPHQYERIRGDWLSLIDVDIGSLPVLEILQPEGTYLPAKESQSPNRQDLKTWKMQAAAIAANHRDLSWHQPSRHEDEGAKAVEVEDVFVDTDIGPSRVPGPVLDTRVRGGLDRGLILHKLMEEVLTSETDDNERALRIRATELIAQRGLEDSGDPAVGPSSAEMAKVVHRTLRLPSIAELRHCLVPEFPMYGNDHEDRRTVLTAGIADAVAVDDDGSISVVVDWKSDAEPRSTQVHLYRKQLRDYLRISSATRGLLVFLTTGLVDEIKI